MTYNDIINLPTGKHKLQIHDAPFILEKHESGEIEIYSQDDKEKKRCSIIYRGRRRNPDNVYLKYNISNITFKAELFPDKISLIPSAKIDKQIILARVYSKNPKEEPRLQRDVVYHVKNYGSKIILYLRFIDVSPIDSRYYFRVEVRDLNFEYDSIEDALNSPDTGAHFICDKNYAYLFNPHQLEVLKPGEIHSKYLIHE